MPWWGWLIIALLSFALIGLVIWFVWYLHSVMRGIGG